MCCIYTYLAASPPPPTPATACCPLCRPAQPLAFGTLHLAIVFFLAFLGGLCGALLGTSYQDEPGVEAWEVGGLRRGEGGQDLWTSG